VSLAQDGLPPLREVIRRHGLAAKKSLGQNFLFDLNLAARIVRAAGNLAGVTVVEIGPGPGGLTRTLLALGAASAMIAPLPRSRRSPSGFRAVSTSSPRTRSRSIRVRGLAPARRGLSPICPITSLRDCWWRG